MNVEWLVPIATEGYKNRKELAPLLEGGLSFILGRRTNIAFTGTAGVGKSVLYDSLSGRKVKRRQSQKKEKGIIKLKPTEVEGKKRLVVSVIPGQANSPPRSEALDEVFEKEQTEGVVHVVSNGFDVVRARDSIDLLIQAGITTVKAYREYQLAEELKDLTETCNRIVDSHRIRRTPKWMVVVSGKVDLYSTVAEVEAARKYYSLIGDSPFSQQLRNLQSRVGTDFIKFDAAPACCTDDDFEWNGTVVKSELKSSVRDEFLAQLLELIASYCK